MHKIKQRLPDLSEDQWAFLAVLQALGGFASIEVIGMLAPLLPGPLFDLLRRAEKAGWLKVADTDHLALNKKMPHSIIGKLEEINTPSQIFSLIKTIRAKGLSNKVDSLSAIQLLNLGGELIAASEIEIDLAQQAIKNKNLKKAGVYFYNVLNRLLEYCDDVNSGKIFVASAIQYSNICFSSGQGLTDIDHYLDKAYEIAEKLGDRRSHGIINFHFGRLFYFSDRREEAQVALSLGYEEIKKIGDEDILSQSSVFLGILFYMQGLFKKAFEHLEKAEQLIETDENFFLYNPMTPLFFGYCAMYLGQFHRAIGNLEFNWRLARDRSDFAMTANIRACLGTVFVLRKNRREAMRHLKQAQTEALENNNAFAQYMSGGGIALQYFIDGNVKKAYEVLKHTSAKGNQAGFIRQYSSPWALEMLAEFHNLDFDPIPGFEYPDVLNRIFKGGNVHLRGVALRLRAIKKIAQGGNLKSIQNDLYDSEKWLKKSGDPIQLAKTIFERARLELKSGNREKALRLSQKACRELGGYADEFIPDDFRNLLEVKSLQNRADKSHQDIIQMYLTEVDVLFPVETSDEVLIKIVRSCNRIFGAERGGIFWFSHEKKGKKPILGAACNLIQKHVEALEFHSNLSLIKKSFQNNQPLNVRLDFQSSAKKNKPVMSILCFPIKIKGKVKGVLYHDNSYLDDAFDFIDSSLLKQLWQNNNAIIARVIDYCQEKEHTNALASIKTIHSDQFEKEIIIGESAIITKLLEQTDQTACTESTILILGESGTGKELLASRIHRKSLCANGPLIIVDSNTIPDTLFESELFGHEKGAFTGADQRKLGYVELANKGTLFLDEIGELPLNIQTKLLRVLQDKSFSRVGGTRKLKSNFRLITATNRDLNKEVKKGRFRQDLYYRLNVIPLTLPPLRNRYQDVILLAQHFVERYGRKYGSDLKLRPQDKKAILQYAWPGNVRELKNVMERAVILSKEDCLELNLPSEQLSSLTDFFSDMPTLDDMQRKYIKFILEYTNGKMSGTGGAAELLGMKRTSLYTRMRKLGIKK